MGFNLIVFMTKIKNKLEQDRQFFSKKHSCITYREKCKISEATQLFVVFAPKSKS